MKQRIVIKVNMHGEKCKRKAMKIAAAAQGMESVSLEDKGGDQVVVVVGDGVDSVCLSNMLRKKFPSATLITVEDVPPGKEDAKPNPKDAKGPDNNDAAGDMTCTCTVKQNPNLSFSYSIPYPPFPPSYPVVYDPYPNSCWIL